MLEVGIVGLPNVGKSTLFKAITNLNVEIANYPFATIEPNVGIVPVRDERLLKLSLLYSPKKSTYTNLKFIDIAGLVRGASEGEGLGNKFLANIRPVDLICHVVRCFSDKDIIHVNNRIDPVSDFQIIFQELLFADINTLIKHKEKIERKAKSGEKKSIENLNLCNSLITACENFDESTFKNLSDECIKYARELNLLIFKRYVVVANLSEQDIQSPNFNEYYLQLEKYLKKIGVILIPICAKMEAELSDVDIMEKKKLLSEMGYTKIFDLNNLIKAIYDCLDLLTFFTCGKDEVRAWPFIKNSLAPQCAGIIHSDFERGFIKAEIIKYDDLIECGSELEVKKQGKIHIEGKNYMVSDGDICYFRFNVTKEN